MKLDISGNLHADADGRFAGHIHTEADGSTVLTSADDLAVDPLDDPRVQAALDAPRQLSYDEEECLRAILDPGNDRGGANHDLVEILELFEDFEATGDDLWLLTDRLGGWYDQQGLGDTFNVDLFEDADGGWCQVSAYIPGRSPQRIMEGFDANQLRPRDDGEPDHGLRVALHAAQQLRAHRHQVVRTLQELTGKSA